MTTTSETENEKPMNDIQRKLSDRNDSLQKLEEKAKKAEEAYEREAKAKKELEGLYAKILAEKTELLNSLEGEKGSLSETQERANKLQAQKNDLEAQLQVGHKFIIYYPSFPQFATSNPLFFHSNQKLRIIFF